MPCPPAPCAPVPALPIALGAPPGACEIVGCEQCSDDTLLPLNLTVACGTLRLNNTACATDDWTPGTIILPRLSPMVNCGYRLTYPVGNQTREATVKWTGSRWEINSVATWATANPATTTAYIAYAGPSTQCDPRGTYTYYTITSGCYSGITYPATIVVS